MQRRLDVFLPLVRSLGGLDDDLQARRAAIAALRALTLTLPPQAAASVFGLLAEALHEEQEEARGGPRIAVARALAVADERARAVSDAVLVAMLEVLGPDAEPVFAALPPELRPEPGRRPDLAPPRASPTASAEPHTLAGGRPGSQHALADAAATRAHQHSIARADDPHADTRLSSTHGEPSAGATLADGSDISPRAP